MAIPTTDQIAQNYAQTLQNNIGYGQRELNKRARMSMPGSDGTQQRTAAPTVDGNSWGARGVQGFRGAGWKDSQIGNVPTMDAETKMILGGRLGEYQQNGQMKQGYYGDYDVRDMNQVGQMLDKEGYAYAKGPEDLDYVNAGLDLASIYGKPIYKKDGFDFTQKPEVDRFMQSLGFGHNLGSTVDLQANTELQGFADNFRKVKDVYSKVPSISDYLFGLGYKDFSNSQFKDYLPLVDGIKMAKSGDKYFSDANEAAFAFANQNDPNALFNQYWNQPGIADIVDKSYTQSGDPFGLYAMQNGNYGIPADYQVAQFDTLGRSFGSRQEAEAFKNQMYQQAMSNSAIRNELLSQALTGGKITGGASSNPKQQGPFPLSSSENIDPDNRGYFGGDKIANQLNADQLAKVLGSKDLSYNGKNLGTIFNKPEDYQDSWKEDWKKHSENWRRTRDRFYHDYGNVGAGIKLDGTGLSSLGNNEFFVGSDNKNNLSGQAIDWRERNKGVQEVKKHTGLGKTLNTIYNFVPFAGGVMSAMDNAMIYGPNKGGLIGAAAGMIAPGLGAIDFGLGSLGNTVAQGALTGAVGGGLGAWANDGSIGKGILTGAVGGAAGGLGGYGAGQLAGTLAPDLGSAATNAIKNIGSGVSRGMATNLMTGKPVMTDIGLRAATSGISSLGNLFAPAGASDEERKLYDNVAKTSANTLSSVYKQKNPTKQTRRT